MKAPTKTKLYFMGDDDEYCHPISWIKNECEGVTSIEVYEAVPIKVDNIFFCKFYKTLGEKGDDFDKCGKECSAYSPRNGKSGCCKYYSNRFYEYGNKITLELI